jgi:hypothetical protein
VSEELISDRYKHIKSLKETSYDPTHDEYMSEADLPVYNFDAIKDEYVSDMGLSETPCSCDALYYNRKAEEYYLIEFKNGIIDNLKNYEIKLKLYDSLLILLDLINKTAEYSRKHVIYILVYNDTKEHTSKQYKQIFINKITSLAKEPIVQFGLNRFNKLYFKKVNTYTQEQFDKYFVKQVSV